MNCKKHPAVVAKVACAACAEPFCESCLVEVKGQKYCAECKTAVIKGAGPESTVCKEAKDALTYAIVGLFCFGIILGPVAISKAVKAKKLIQENPRLEGAGKATAAIIIGILATLFSAAMIVAKIAMAAG